MSVGPTHPVGVSQQLGASSYGAPGSAVSPHQALLTKMNLTYPEIVNTVSDGLPSLKLKQFPEDSGKPAVTITVNPNIENPISTAIDQAQEGATIYVRTGKYEESLNISKSVHFIAQGKVSLGSLGGETTINISKGNVSFDGFSIKQKKSRARGAILISGGSLRLTNSKLSSLANATINAKNDSFVDINHCFIKGKNGAGLIINHTCQAVVEQTTFSLCKVTTVSLRGSSVGSFKQCIFLNNPQAGIASVDEAQLYVDSCRFVECMAELGSSGEVNVIKGSVFDKTGGSSGIVVTMNATVFLNGNTIRGCCVDLRNNSTTKLNSNVYEGSSFLASHQATATSENESFSGETPVAIGVHDSASATLKNTKLNNVSGVGLIVYENGKANCSHVSMRNIGLQGVICHSGGDVDLEYSDIQQTSEDAILVQDAVLTLKNVLVKNGKKNAVSIADSTSCIIKDSKLESNQHCGLICSRSAITIDDSQLTNNGYSAIHSINSDIKLTKCTISQNSKGGISSIQKSKVSASNCTLKQNKWAAIHCDDNGKVKCVKTLISENQYGINCAGKVTLAECELTNHHATAVQVSGKLKVKGSTFSGNETAIIGGNNGNITVSETTFTGNGLCVEATDDASFECTECKFIGTTGESAVSVTGGEAQGSLSKCHFTQSKNVAIYADGKLDLEETTIEKTAKISLLCTENSSGNVKNNKFEGNGDCGVQIGGGKSVIQSNTIQNFSQFGVYIKPNSQASVEDNKISNNKLANIWKE